MQSPRGPIRLVAVAAALATIIPATLSAQMEPTTPRRTDEGDGPHERLILRGATIIDGTGAPPSVRWIS